MYDADSIDSDLIARAKKGETIALQRLLYLSMEPLREYLQRRINREFSGTITVDDILQETLFRLQRRIATLESNCPATYLAWIRRIAKNQLCSQIRGIRAKKRGGDHEQIVSDGDSSIVTGFSDKALTPAGTAERDEVIIAVQSNLDELPTTQRKAVKLHHIQSRTVKETAEELGVSPTKVRSLLGRAKRTMRSALGGSSKWFSRK